MADKDEHQKKSDICFNTTDAIKIYLTLARTNETILKFASVKLRKWGLSVPKYGVLLQLYDYGPLKLSELGTLVFRGDSNLTGLIDRMERDGLVKKSNGLNDRRVREISLTDKGREMAPKVIREFRRFLHERIANVLSSDEQESLLGMLNQVKTECQRALEARSPRTPPTDRRRRVVFQEQQNE
jgi:MarR family transcriptional regulator, 2-MHQ and catechol-resistance regulon repressor